MVNIDVLNSWNDAEASAAFLRCCGSARWAERMTALRPFAGAEELFAAAVRVWRGLTAEDWLQAFAAHPKIGDPAASHERFSATAAWSAAEQAGAASAGEATRQALAEANRQYQARFGYIFIVCASGKGADEMLALLRGRLNNGPAEELVLAAGEQEKITRLRLEKLCP